MGSFLEAKILILGQFHDLRLRLDDISVSPYNHNINACGKSCANYYY